METDLVKTHQGIEISFEHLPKGIYHFGSFQNKYKIFLNERWPPSLRVATSTKITYIKKDATFPDSVFELITTHDTKEYCQKLQKSDFEQSDSFYKVGDNFLGFSPIQIKNKIRVSIVFVDCERKKTLAVHSPFFSGSSYKDAQQKALYYFNTYFAFNN